MLTCPNTCSSRTHVLLSLQQHTTFCFFLSSGYCLQTQLVSPLYKVSNFYCFSVFGPSTKGNLHLDPGKPTRLHHQQQQPHTSSPAGNCLPQFLDLSPLIPAQNLGPKDSHNPYSIVSLPPPSKDLLDTRLDNDYTESCTIKVGQPCQLASLTTADFPSHLAGGGRQPVPKFGRALQVGSHKSASMPRRHYSKQRSRKDSQGNNDLF